MSYLLGRLPSAEPASKKPEGPVPCLLRPDGVVLGGGNAVRPHGGLVGEGMMCQVASEIEGHPGSAQFVLQRVDGGYRKKLVLRRPVRQQRRLDLGRVDVLERRAAVPDDARIDLRGHAHAEQRQGTPHAKAGHADFDAARLEVLHGAAMLVRDADRVHNPSHTRRPEGNGLGQAALQALANHSVQIHHMIQCLHLD
jgi:hypothetical protein